MNSLNSGRQIFFRALLYALGSLILALGLVLNSKAGLGVSPIISVAFSASIISGINFPDVTFVWYVILVVFQLLIHWKGRRPRALFIADVLQLPFSVVFTRFMGLFVRAIPDCSASGMAIQLPLLFTAIACTGIGAAMSLNMRLVPNPGDGLVQAVSDAWGRETGFCKNCVDAVCFASTLLMSFLTVGRPAGVGVGTLCALVGTGRVIALFNRLFKKPMQALAGVQDPPARS